METDITKTGERIIPENIETSAEYLLYLRHLFAYEFARSIIPKDSLVLEVGCGEGYGTNFLSQCVEKVVGLDIDDKTINHASNKYCSQNCIFKTYNGSKIPFKDNTFDTIISFQVIEHIQDDKKYISEMRRVLKPSSPCILTTPNREYRLAPGQRPWNRFHVREYSTHSLKELLDTMFYDVTIWGIRGTEEIQKIERGRVEQIVRISALDPFKLRRFIPESLTPKIIALLKKMIQSNRKSENNKKFFEQYKTTDFEIIKDNLGQSLELLGICIK